MYGVGNFNKTYNPNSKKNTLSDIKRLLTSRDISTQNKACNYLIQVVSRYKENTDERVDTINYLLDNDIVVFLCEATSNLDFSLFRSVLECMRLFWYGKRFFEEEHAAHALSAVVRALTHYAGIDSTAAINVSLHFLCDLFDCISSRGSTSPLSHQSAYSVEQLLACLNSLVQCFNKDPKSVLCSALVLHSLISYQPPNLVIRACVAKPLAHVLNIWLELLLAALNHTVLVDRVELSGKLLVVTSHIATDVLKLIDLIKFGNQRTDFLQNILIDEQEINTLEEAVKEMKTSIQRTSSELIMFIKENQNQIDIEEYTLFLKFLLNFLHHHSSAEYLSEFCDTLFAKEYLTILPNYHITGNNSTVQKLSTVVLGEMLKVLTVKYLHVNETDNSAICFKDIHYRLTILQHGLKKPETVGEQLQKKSQPYSLLIYIYFYCQSSTNCDDFTSSLLPHLIEHILRLPQAFKPPLYIIKALWLVFAMATISNSSLKSLVERVYLEKATDCLMTMLLPEPSIFYTHNPAILLWCFSSQRISNYVRTQVLTQWFKNEDALPDDLSKEFEVWEHLLNIIIQCKDEDVVSNCMETLNLCLDGSEDEPRQAFANVVWSMLPEFMSKALIDYQSQIETNLYHLMEIATNVLPDKLDQTVCPKVAVVLAAIFTKNNAETSYGKMNMKNHFEYVCLKLCLILLGIAHKQNDNRVLLIYTNREGFLQAVLSVANHADECVACAALQLLTYVVRYFTGNHYQPKMVLLVQTEMVIKSLREDSISERGALLLQFISTMLNVGTNAPLALSHDISQIPSEEQQWTMLRALMFRTQLTLCCRDSEEQRTIGWKTLTSIFKYAVVHKKDIKLVSILTSQPWTHALIRFQLSLNLTEEFLLFAHDWLILLKITLRKSQERRKCYISKYNPIAKTLKSLKKSLEKDDDHPSNVKQMIVKTIKDIAEGSSIAL